MVMSAGQNCVIAFHRIRTRGASLLSLVLVAAIALSIASTPADAKRRHHFVRRAYAPPQSAMVLDAYSGKILYSANIDEHRFPASITKVMTLYLVFEQLKEGRLKLDSELKVSANAAGQAPSKLDLEPGSTITVREAMYALVTKSANDVAVTFAENLAGTETNFAQAMTRKAHALGMNNTTFRNASGLPDPEQVTTARDLIILAQRILADFPEHAPIFKTRVFAYGGEEHRNHNGLLFSYPGTEGLKTGFTHASGFNLLATVKRDDKHLLAVVLGGSSARDRNARMRTLLNAAWGKAVTLASLKAKGQAIASASVLTKRGPIAKPVVAAMAGGGGGEVQPAPKPSAASVADDFVVAVGDIPERNPAFHPTVSERTLAVAMGSVNSGQKPAQVAETQTALAAAADTSKTDPGITGGSAIAQGAAAQVASTKGASPQGEGDTAAAIAPGVDPSNTAGPYHIQVGSYLSVSGAKGALQKVHAKASDFLSGHGELTVAGTKEGKAYYRARFGSFSETQAKSACTKLEKLDIECLVMRAE